MCFLQEALEALECTFELYIYVFLIYVVEAEYDGILRWTYRNVAPVIGKEELMLKNKLTKIYLRNYVFVLFHWLDTWAEACLSPIVALTRTSTFLMIHPSSTSQPTRPPHFYSPGPHMSAYHHISIHMNPTSLPTLPPHFYPPDRHISAYHTTTFISTWTPHLCLPYYHISIHMNPICAHPTSIFLSTYPPLHCPPSLHICPPGLHI